MKSLIIVFLLLFSSIGDTKNIGVVGQTYPIIEKDFLVWIHERLLSLQTTGELQALQKQWVNNAKKHADRPESVVGISPAKETKTQFLDPSIVLLSDIRDHQGRVLVAAGTRINPLETVSLREPLVFYDGDNDAQVQWVKHYDENHQHHVKLILVKGSVSSQIDVFHKAIYFDQEGRLTHRFQIQHIPAVVTQEGLKLKIQEMGL